MADPLPRLPYGTGLGFLSQRRNAGPYPCTRIAVTELVIGVSVLLVSQERMRRRDGEDGIVGEATPAREEREVRLLDPGVFVDRADHITGDGTEHDELLSQAATSS